MDIGRFGGTQKFWGFAWIGQALKQAVFSGNAIEP